MIKISETKNQLKIQVDVKTNWQVVIPVGIWLVGMSGGILWFGYGLVYYSDKVDFSFIFSMLTIIWSITLLLFFRNIGRTETLTVYESCINVAKTGWLGTSTTYELSSVTQFYYRSEEELPTWMKFWGLNNGEVVFEYVDMPKRFGRGINKNEALEIVEKIKQFVSNTAF